MWVNASRIIDDLGDEFTFQKFEILYLGKNTQDDKAYDVYLAFEEYIKNLKEEKRIGSAETMSNSLKSFRKYAPTLNLKEVTVGFLEDYEKYMLDNEKSRTTIGIYVRDLRTILNVFRGKKLLSDDVYPFGSKKNGKYEIPTSKNSKKALNEEHLKAIINYVPHSDEATRARDLWLYSFYCNGMNMADIFSLRYENIKKNYLKFYRKKTIRTRKKQEYIEIFLNEFALNIIDRWGNKKKAKKNFIFNVFTDDMTEEEKHLKTHHTVRSINGYVQRMIKHLGFDIDISTYYARHSWATTLLRNGVPVGYISKGLGHTSFSTTENYLADFTDEQKIEASNLIVNLLSK